MKILKIIRIMILFVIDLENIIVMVVNKNNNSIKIKVISLFLKFSNIFVIKRNMVIHIVIIIPIIFLLFQHPKLMLISLEK